MSACEKCWREAGGDADVYLRRMAHKATPCTPEEQAGPDAEPCPECGGRRVRHQHTGECMVNPMHGREYLDDGQGWREVDRG